MCLAFTQEVVFGLGVQFADKGVAEGGVEVWQIACLDKAVEEGGVAVVPGFFELCEQGADVGDGGVAVLTVESEDEQRGAVFVGVQAEKADQCGCGFGSDLCLGVITSFAFVADELREVAGQGGDLGENLRFGLARCGVVVAALGSELNEQQRFVETGVGQGGNVGFGVVQDVGLQGSKGEGVVGGGTVGWVSAFCEGFIPAADDGLIVCLFVGAAGV